MISANYRNHPRRQNIFCRSSGTLTWNRRVTCFTTLKTGKVHQVRRFLTRTRIRESFSVVVCGSVTIGLSINYEVGDTGTFGQVYLVYKYLCVSCWILFIHFWLEVGTNNYYYKVLARTHDQISFFERVYDLGRSLRKSRYSLLQHCNVALSLPCHLCVLSNQSSNTNYLPPSDVNQVRKPLKNYIMS